MTARDRQSRYPAEFETWARDRGLISKSHGITSEWSGLGLALEAWQAGRALPAGIEPVAEVVECRVMGQQTVWELNGAWKFLPYGTKLYTAAQVQTMLAHRGYGEGANQPQTRMHAGASPGRGLPPAGGQVDCIGLALELESQAKRVESQSVERAMAAAAHGLRLLAPDAMSQAQPDMNGADSPTTGAQTVITGAQTVITGAGGVTGASSELGPPRDLYQSRMGLSCSKCTDGKYRADSNGYNAFHRCDKCLHVPMWMADSTELVAPIK